MASSLSLDSRDLSTATYRQLQSLAKSLGITANQKKTVLIDRISELRDAEKENQPPTLGKKSEGKNGGRKGLGVRSANKTPSKDPVWKWTKDEGSSVKRGRKGGVLATLEESEKLTATTGETISFQDWDIDDLTSRPQKPNTHIRFVYDDSGENIVGEEEVVDEAAEDANDFEGEDEEVKIDDDEEINEPVERMADEAPVERSLTDARARATGFLPAGVISDKARDPDDEGYIKFD
eukprot:CAMPEP_0197521960 /NCGR_PEP_ID=MMETSP1318-20131121/7166_1 /TAXON_ID=552666 /ORGANISM="Partenskyella glossopodia, Strain RCC365" /LENGTH=235 /DNA_ID=CAMNT_0043074147 /DNA_START=38 /DNA_END=745 /DNA_ORIENTATION=+